MCARDRYNIDVAGKVFCSNLLEACSTNSSLIKMKNKEAKTEPFLFSNIYQVRRCKDK